MGRITLPWFCRSGHQKVAYGIGLTDLIVSACLYLHVAAKYLFVRILRNSPHLQQNTWIHWTTWLSCNCGLASISFILAEAVPIFNYLIALTGSVYFAPLAIALPGFLWLYDYAAYRKGSLGQKLLYCAHCFLPLLGAFLCVGGTYGVVQLIINAYADHEIGEAPLHLSVNCILIGNMKCILLCR
jgi:Transmembrane amino acid transporter protein